MQRKDTLHSVAEGDLAHGKGGVAPGVPLPDDDAFENLNALLVAFFDLHVHANGIAGLELRQALLGLLLFDFLECCWHDQLPNLNFPDNPQISQIAGITKKEKDEPKYPPTCLAETAPLPASVSV